MSSRAVRISPAVSASTIPCSTSITTWARSTARSAAKMRSSSDSEERNDRAGPPAKRSRRTTASPPESALASPVSWSSPSLIRLLLRGLARGVRLVAAAVRHGGPFLRVVQNLVREAGLEAVVLCDASCVLLGDPAGDVLLIERGRRLAVDG